MDALYSRHPVLNDNFLKGKTPNILPKQEFLGLPENSFGKKVGEFLSANELEVKFYPQLDLRSRENFVNSSAYAVHDLWHVLLGLTTSVEDETCLLAFNAGQFRSSLSLIVVCGGFIHICINQPLEANRIFNKLIRFFELGQNTPFLLGEPLDQMYHLPLEQVRERVGLVQLEARAA